MITSILYMVTSYAGHLYMIISMQGTLYMITSMQGASMQGTYI